MFVLHEGDDMKSLEDEFHDAMIDVYKIAVAECNYRAKAFLSMVIEIGGLSTAKRLLWTDDLIPYLEFSVVSRAKYTAAGL